MGMVWESTQIQMLAAGKGWVALDKPAGITVHNAAENDLCSIARQWIQKNSKTRDYMGLGENFSLSPVHRLDKHSSGVILLAANREILRFFSDQFESRQTVKRYIAIVHGRLELGKQDTAWGSWTWPLTKTAGGRQKPQGSGRRVPSETRFKILKHSAHYTMVEIDLLTGRKHQIRRHAKLSGHPVVGDERYGSTRSVNYLKQQAGFARLGLHAQALTLNVPGAEKPQTIKSSELPAEMKNLVETDSKG
jgi:RluA family pseudouridine synthase